MICPNGIESVTVLADNGEESKLFLELLAFYKDKNIALEQYLISKSEDFLSWYGEGEFNSQKEPLFNKGSFKNASGDIKTAYFQNITPKKSRLQEAFDNILDNVNRNYEIYHNNDYNLDVKDTIKNVREKMLSSANEMSAIVNYIEATNEISHQLLERISDFEKINDISKLSQAEKAAYIKHLRVLLDMRDSFDILEQFADVFVENSPFLEKAYDSPNDRDEVSKKVAQSLLNLKAIENIYKSKAVPLIADYIMSSVSEEDLKEMNKKIQNSEGVNRGNIINREYIEAQLLTASSDISWSSMMLSPLISSSDPILALFAKKVKGFLQDARIKDLDYARKIQEVVDKYAKDSGKNISSDSFNDNIIEDVEYYEYDPETDERKLVVKRSLVSKYDMNAFNKEINDLFKKRSEIQKKIDVETSRSQKSQLIEESKKLTKRIREISSYKIITREDGTKETYYNYNLPNENYKKNEKYEKLSNVEKEYLDSITKDYFEMQSKLPSRFRKNYALPSVNKTLLNRISQNGPKNATKEAINSLKVREIDNLYGIQNQQGEQVKSIPIYYTQKMDPEDVSKDLHSSMMLFSKMVNNYSAIKENIAAVDLYQNLIGKREVLKTNWSGKNIKDKVAKSINLDKYIKKEGESNSKRAVSEFINTVIYGEYQAREHPMLMAASKNLIKYTSWASIAGNFLGGFSNALYAQISNLIEVTGSEHYKKRDLVTAEAKYFSNMADIVADSYRNVPKTLYGALLRKYDPLMNESNSYGTNLNTKDKVFDLGHAFVLQNAGEHWGQSITLFALLQSKKVMGPNGEVSLIDAYEMKDGKLSVKEGYNVSKEFEDKIKNISDSINKRVHGVYEDNVAATRYAVGRLALVFRKYIYSGFKARFGTTNLEMESGDVKEGHYRAFWNIINNSVKHLYKGDAMEFWKTVPEYRKKAAKKALTELILGITSMVVLSMWANSSDDDEDSYLEKFFIYQLMKLQSDLLFYVYPSSTLKSFSSPTATYNSLQRLINLIGQATSDGFSLATGDDIETFQRKSGSFQAGDSKLYARFVNALPIIGQIEKALTPQEQIIAFRRNVLVSDSDSNSNSNSDSEFDSDSN